MFICSSAQLLPLLGQRSDHYTAIIVEEPDSYVGREVTETGPQQNEGDLFKVRQVKAEPRSPKQ